jgi:hypothetical protein
MEKSKPPATALGRLWAFWKRNSLRVYAAGAVYLLLMALLGCFTAPLLNFKPSTFVGYLILSPQETAALGISTLITGIVMLAAVIGYVALTRRWWRMLALLAVGVIVWLAGLTFLLNFWLMPRAAIAEYNGQVYQLAYEIFGSYVKPCGGEGELVYCRGIEYQLYACSSLALNCHSEGSPFSSEAPRLEVVDGALRVQNYDRDGNLLETEIEIRPCRNGTGVCNVAYEATE